MKSAHVCSGALLVLALAGVLTGCGKQGPHAVAQAFVSAMGKGDTTTAAGYWDYITYCKQQNPDWDTFGKAQKDLIIQESKFEEKRATELGYWKTHFPRASKVVSVTEQGDTATATLEGARVGELILVKHDDQWYVSDLR